MESPCPDHLAFLWFVVGLTALLRRVEGEPAWRSTVALVSGTLVAAYGVVDASWDAAANRGSELDPGVALYAFDLGNLGFANVWLAMASFAIAVGWVLLDSRALPAWWGWTAVVSGLGLIVARFAWEESLWLLPYGLFWVWIIALATRLIRRPHLDPKRGHGARTAVLTTRERRNQKVRGTRHSARRC